tara:strand:+ start:1590 stop:1886 length:297 start_codon:yes stop_codon:yes gene_type:complete
MVPYPKTEIARMIEDGVGGFIKRSVSWKDYNKQYGNAIELKSLSRWQLEMLQIIAYIAVLIFNFRILQLLRDAREYRLNAKTLLIKFFSSLFLKKNER